MMYDGLTDMTVPAYVSSRGPEIRARWILVYETVFAHTGSDLRALYAANMWLRRKLQKESLASQELETPVPQEQEFMVSRSSHRSVVRFSVDTSKDFIKRSDNGEEYIIAMLQDVYGDSDGVLWTPEVLQQFAEQINQGTIVGDVDHKEYDQILDAATTDEQVERMLSRKKGIAKSVQAVFENGQLWMKAIIDKRYKKALQGKNLSLEAVVTRDDEGRVLDGKILGFTFIVNDTAANPRTAFVDA